MSRFFTDTLAELEPYVPGEQPTGHSFIKLNTNENPYPPSPAVRQAAADAVPDLRLYSDLACTELKQAVAQHYHLAPENILCGNGSDENLMLAIRAFCDEKHPLAFADCTYGFYRVWCDLFHIPAHILPLRPDFSLDPADYAGLDETIVIANPNAPTSLALPAGAIAQIAAQNPGRVVIADEAYVDFAAPGTSAVPLIETHKNLLVVQTFSKSRNLAGARLGLCLGDKALIDDLERVRYSMNPYNVNALTQAAGTAAMRDEAYFDDCCAKIIAARTKTTKELRALGMRVLDSSTNFLFAGTPQMPGAKLYARLREKEILVRHFDTPRLTDWLRITVGTPEQMDRLVCAVKEILAG
jgi:histidinol-phosphate aminotransferase